MTPARRESGAHAAYTAAVPESEQTPRRGLILAALIVPLFMALMGVSIVNVSLPAIQGGLDASTSQLQWVLSGYALTFGLLLVPAGRLGDVYGRERLFLAGVGLFALASLGAALAPSATLLNVSRLFMGLGSGLFSPQIIGMVQQHFRGPDRARAFGVMGSVIGLALAVGPLVGGLIIGALGPDAGWRWVFGVNVPTAVLAVVAGWRWLPRTRRRPAARVDLDPVGVAVFGAAMLALMLPFVRVTSSPLIWLALPVGLALLVGWFVWEGRYAARGGEPMVDRALLREPGFAYGTALIFCYFVGLTPSWAVLALFVQEGLGQSALVAGLITVPAALAGSVASVVGGRLVSRHGRPLVAWGTVVAVVGQLGTAVLALVAGEGPLALWALAGAFLVVGIAQGLVIGPNQSLTLAEVPVANGGAAGGVMQTGQRMGAAMGLAVGTGTLYAALDARGDWHQAVFLAFAVSSLATLVALVVAVLDARRRSVRVGPGAPHPAPAPMR